MARRKRDWISDAVEHPGRVHRYLERLYGKKAFAKKGTIKQEYLNKAIKRAKAEGNTSLVRALYLAKTLKKIRKK